MVSNLEGITSNSAASSDFLILQRSNYRVILFLGILALSALFVVYKNHFDNPFELDDSHTIVNNAAIRELNVPLFFQDATTFSTLPSNQSYRPGLTTLNALDYKLWSKTANENPQPRWFHISTFIVYCLLCIGLYFLYSYFFRYAFPNHPWNSYFALFAAMFFGFHAANAETVNYIIQRAEIYSTLGVVTAFLIFIYSKKRSLQLFLVPVVIGFFIKEPAIMFAPLLFVFLFLFEENASLRYSDIFSKKLLKPLLYSFSALLVGLVLFIISKKHTPESWTSGSENVSSFNYLITNFYSVMHYVFNFLLPVNLSVDTDLQVFDNLFDDRVIAGGLLILSMLTGAYYFSLRKETRPAAYGILWFLITLIPTSTIIPFAEPLNDHRPFFGYIGLVLVVANLFALVFVKRKEIALAKKMPKPVMLALPLLLITLHGYGAFKRNEIWAKEETLWKDATEKCPHGARIWMNYGLTLMRRADYNGALDAFNQAKIYAPYYSYLYINFAILKNAIGKTVEAESDFLLGIKYGPQSPDGYKFYGDYLLNNNRPQQADSICTIGLQFSPQNAGLLELKQRIVTFTAQVPLTLDGMEQKTKSNPTPENWINLSLARYNTGDYIGCVDAAEEVLKLDPENLAAFNNICAAYNMLGSWKKAAEAGNRGLQFHPENQLLRNNVQVSLSHLQ